MKPALWPFITWTLNTGKRVDLLWHSNRHQQQEEAGPEREVISPSSCWSWGLGSLWLPDTCTGCPLAPGNPLAVLRALESPPMAMECGIALLLEGRCS